MESTLKIWDIRKKRNSETGRPASRWCRNCNSAGGAFPSHPRPPKISSHPPHCGLCDRLQVISPGQNSHQQKVITLIMFQDSKKEGKIANKKMWKLKMGSWRDVTEGSLCGSGFPQTYIFSKEFFFWILLKGQHKRYFSKICFVLYNLYVMDLLSGFTDFWMTVQYILRKKWDLRVYLPEN